MRKKYRNGVVLPLSFVLLILPLKAMACPFELPAATISINGHTLTVKTATIPSARHCGLSNREELPKNQGMLFVYPTARPLTFWMRGTHIPLSVAFIDESGKIINIYKMLPNQTDERYTSSRPAKFALEVNQGWFQACGIEIGDTVEMTLPLVIDIY